MRTITFIRHGKSSWKEPGLEDFNRPLNRRGKTDALLMGLILSKKLIMADVFIASPAKRTLETAKIISGPVEYPRKKIQTEQELYLATDGTIISLLAGVNDRYMHVFLCGHNPGISGAINVLAGGTHDEMPTCGIAHFEMGIPSWKDLSPGCGILKFTDSPKRHY